MPNLVTKLWVVVENCSCVLGVSGVILNAVGLEPATNTAKNTIKIS